MGSLFGAYSHIVSCAIVHPASSSRTVQSPHQRRPCPVLRGLQQMPRSIVSSSNRSPMLDAASPADPTARSTLSSRRLSRALTAANRRTAFRAIISRACTASLGALAIARRFSAPEIWLSNDSRSSPDSRAFGGAQKRKLQVNFQMSGYTTQSQLKA